MDTDVFSSFAAMPRRAPDNQPFADSMFDFILSCQSCGFGVDDVLPKPLYLDVEPPMPKLELP